MLPTGTEILAPANLGRGLEFMLATQNADPQKGLWVMNERKDQAEPSD